MILDLSKTIQKTFTTLLLISIVFVVNIGSVNAKVFDYTFTADKEEFPYENSSAYINSDSILAASWQTENSTLTAKVANNSWLFKKITLKYGFGEKFILTKKLILWPKQIKSYQISKDKLLKLDNQSSLLLYLYIFDSKNQLIFKSPIEKAKNFSKLTGDNRVYKKNDSLTSTTTFFTNREEGKKYFDFFVVPKSVSSDDWQAINSLVDVQAENILALKNSEPVLKQLKINSDDKEIKDIFKNLKINDHYFVKSDQAASLSIKHQILSLEKNSLLQDKAWHVSCSGENLENCQALLFRYTPLVLLISSQILWVYTVYAAVMAILLLLISLIRRSYVKNNKK